MPQEKELAMRSGTIPRKHARAYCIGAACFLPLAALAQAGGANQFTRPGLGPAQRIIARAGVSNDSTATGVAWQRDWGWAWDRPWGWSGQFSATTEFALDYWRAKSGPDGPSDDSWRIGVTPLLRYSFAGPRGWFVEAGIGANLITPLYRANGKRFSTAFNFGNHLGFGWRSAGQHAWHWAVRVEHYSNADIKRPNPGENFVRFEIGFEF